MALTAAASPSSFPSLLEDGCQDGALSLNDSLIL